MKNIIIIIPFLLFISCLEQPPSLFELENPHLVGHKTIWKTYLGRVAVTSITLRQHFGDIVLANNRGWPKSEMDTLFGINRHNGEIVWKTPFKNSLYRGVAIDGKLFTCSNGIFNIINTQTGTIECEQQLEGWTDIVEGGLTNDSLVLKNQTEVFLFHADNPTDIKTVTDRLIPHFLDKEPEGMQYRISSVDKIANSNRLLIGYTTSMTAFTKLDPSKFSYLCYDFGTDSVVYHRKHLVDNISASRSHINEENSVIILRTTDYKAIKFEYVEYPAKFFRIDLNTGEIVWENSLTYTWYDAPTFCGDYFIVSDVQDMWCYRLSDGAVMWNFYGYGNAFKTGVYHNGIVYFGTGAKLVAHEVESGKKLWHIQDESEYFAELVLVPGPEGEKPRVIARSGSHIYCFECIR